MHNVQEYIVLL